MTRVRDVLTEVNDKATSENDHTVLTLTEKNGFVRQEDRFKKRLAKEDTSGYKVVRRDYIAFNPYLLWAAAIARNTIVDIGIVSPLYPTFVVDKECDPGYIGRLLLSDEMVKSYDSIAFGSIPRRRRSSVRDFLNLQLPHLPSITEQRRIASILDDADAIRAKRRAQLAHLDELPNTLFHETFPPGASPTRPLGELALVSSGITVGRRTSERTRAIPYLAVANVQAGSLALDNVKYIEATEREIERYSLDGGDVILTEGGDPDKLGRGTVWREELPACLHQNHVFRVRFPEDGGILSEYFAALLGQKETRQYFLRSAKQTTGIASINMTQLRALPIPVPDTTLQRAFLESLAAIRTERDRVARALVADEELFAALQHRAFRGEL